MKLWKKLPRGVTEITQPGKRMSNKQFRKKVGKPAPKEVARLRKNLKAIDKAERSARRKMKG